MTTTIKKMLSAGALVAGLAFTGCASTGGDAAGETKSAAAVAKPTTVEEQFALGQKAYGTYCASCHGADGKGSDMAPAVVGVAEGALPLDPPATRKARKGQFHTAMDVAQFAVANMPPAPKAKPSADEYWAIIAFDLTANGVKPTAVVGPENAASYVIHP